MDAEATARLRGDLEAFGYAQPLGDGSAAALVAALLEDLVGAIDSYRALFAARYAGGGGTDGSNASPIGVLRHTGHLRDSADPEVQSLREENASLRREPQTEGRELQTIRMLLEQCAKLAAAVVGGVEADPVMVPVSVCACRVR